MNVSTIEMKVKFINPDGEMVFTCVDEDDVLHVLMKLSTTEINNAE